MPPSPDRTPDRASATAGTPGLVSVIIPTYNRAYIVGKAIDSVLRQTYANVEVVVVDDGSTDGTADLLRRYDHRVRYLAQKNAGVSAARNTGLRAARGEFIALLDSDDEWLPWKVELQVRFLRAFPAVGMVWTDMTAIDPTGRLVKDTYLRDYYSAYSRVNLAEYLTRSGQVGDVWRDAPAGLGARAFRHGDLFPAMFLGNLVHTSTVMLRRERFLKVQGFDLDLKVSGEDYDFHLRTCAEGDVGLIDVSSILYRVDGSDQLSGPAQMLFMATNNLKTMERCLREHRARITLPASKIRRQLSDAYCWLGEEELRAGKNRQAIGHLVKGLVRTPLRLRAWTCLAASCVPPPLFRQGLSLLRTVRGTAA
jgi:glycosyltransferase involved in cell wall biosynthesis